MKIALKVWALMALAPVIVLAQSQASLDEEVNAELDRMYQGQQSAPAAKPAPAPAPQVIQQPVVAAAPVAAQTAPAQAVQITVQTAAPVAAAPVAQPAPVVAQPIAVPQQAVKQPTTVIEASPLVESKAEQLRKSRQDAELSTEQGIVEKLEQSRLEDEKRRAEVLFGDKFNSLMAQGQKEQTAVAVSAAVPAPVVAPVAVAPAAPVVPVVVPEQVVTAPIEPPPAEVSQKEKPMDREAVRGEVSAALAEMQKLEEKPKLKTYMSMMAGSADYPDAVNVKPGYGLGIGIGREMKERLFLEGSFLYSNYQVEQRQLNSSYYSGSCYYDNYGNCYPRITEMNQYSTSALVKYQVLGGMFRPEIGSLVSYTYRTYTDKQFAISDATVTSQALDFGIMGGLAIELGDSFSVGLDMRYMWNMTNKVDGTALQKSAIYQGYQTDKPVEELSYWNTSIVGRATF